jgi:hypothetical protein
MQAWRPVLLLALLMPGIAPAQGTSWSIHPALQDRWNLQFGLQVPTIRTDARLDSAAGRGTSVNFEDTLGLSNNKAMPVLLGMARLGERWRLEFEASSLHRSGSRTLDRTINWGNNSYTFGTTVASQFDSDIFRLSGGYSFVKSNVAELGVALGLHATDFSTSLSAPNLGAQRNDVIAPLPTIGVYGAYAFTPRWLLSGRVDYFSLNVDNYSGSLVNFNAGVDYRFARNFGVGLGYRHVDYQLSASNSRFTGDVNYRFSGPMFYLTGSF